MAPDDTCPSCGKALVADAPRGLCPECLMRAGLGTGVAPGSAEPPPRLEFSPPSPAELKRVFPQLEIEALLGQGGMGAVYKARQPALDRWIALKILSPQAAAQSGFGERFTREARALARLNHPHIVAVHEFGQAEGLPYLVLEYVDGVTLRELLRQQRLTPGQALQVVPQICEALQFAHEAGVVHRDIKPENILLDKNGWVKITDFGIAKMVGGEGQPALTQDEQVIGTPHYMAPEQVEHPQRVDCRADIYSLGVVFYEMLTGELPLGKFPPPSRKVRIDVRLDEIVLHALEKEPERRYQHAREVKTDVQSVTSRVSPSPVGMGTVPGGRSHPRTVLIGIREALLHCSQKTLVLWAVTASLAAAMFLGLFLYRQPSPKVFKPAVRPSDVWSSSPPSTADDHTSEAFALLFEKRDPVGARAVFEICVREHPDSGEAHHGLALAQREAGEPVKALPNHDRALELSPGRADYYFARGMTYQRLRKPDAAIRDFELGLAQKPIECLTPGLLQVGLAQCYRAKGNFQKALDYIDQAVALNPQNKGFYRERGYTYQALGDRQRAEADFRMSRASR